MTPKNQFIQIRQIKEDSKVGKIYLPGNVSSTHAKAEILAVSDQLKDFKYKTGDKIIFFKRGIVCTLQDETEFIRHDQILCII
jgi:co-chaperonin GroES (HSP10)